MKVVRKLISHTVNDHYISLITNAAEIRIMFLNDHIMRIRAGFEGDFEEESYILAMTAWDDRLDDMMEGYRMRVEPEKFQVSETENSLVIDSSGFRVEAEKEPFLIRVYDSEGNLLHADVQDLAYREDTNKRRIHTSEIRDSDCFFGFGEKTGELNKAGKFLNMSPKDAMGFDPKETDSLYKHIPFYIKLNRDTKRAVGYFYHNTCECDFNMGREKSNYWKKHSTYRTDGGDIDLFLIAGPGVREVTARYTELTGMPAMLPKGALGYLGSSMYYPELPENCDDAILEFIDTTVDERIPADGFQLSSGYTSQETENGTKRCVFTWNEKRFKDPKDFFKQMEARGITVSPNVKPGILTVHPELSNMKKENIFVREADSSEPAVGTWWGGPGVFVDFTDPHAREIWKKYLTERILKMGTASVWNDNCEYDSIVDLDAKCDFDGKGGRIGQLKAVMANLMCRLTVEAIREEYPDKRPFVVCRSGHSGIQRFAQTWAGDNETSWDSLKYNIATILGMSLSGQPNEGCDVGGFYGPSPEPELFVRWIQNGIFMPRFSIHSTNTDNTVTEPWMYADCTDMIRDAICLRYRLFPYFYSLMERAHEFGLPIMEPLCSAFQEDPECYDESVNFMLGDSLFAANVVKKGAKTKKIYFPKGHVFYDFYTRKPYEGGRTYEIPVSLNTIPLFLKDNAILPMAGNQMYNLTKEEVTSWNILIAADHDNEFTIYEDDGISNDFEKGIYKKTVILLLSGEKTVIHFESQGAYESPVKEISLDVIHREKAPFYVMLGEKILPHYLNRKRFEKAEKGWYYSQSLKSVQIRYRKPENDHEVVISFKEHDLIGM